MYSNNVLPAQPQSILKENLKYSVAVLVLSYTCVEVVSSVDSTLYILYPCSGEGGTAHAHGVWQRPGEGQTDVRKEVSRPVIFFLFYYSFQKKKNFFASPVYVVM